MALIPDTEIKVPIKYVGKIDSQNIYERFASVAGEKSRELYFIKDGMLQTVPGYSHKMKNRPVIRICSARNRRGVDELCASKPPFGKGDKNNFVDFRVLINDIPALGFFYSHLKNINPVRHNILKRSMSNTVRISSDAENKIMKMTDKEIISSFKKYTGVKIEPEMVVTVIRYVRDTNQAIMFYYENREDRILIGMGYNNNGFTAAHVHYDEKFYTIILENFFKLSSPSDIYKVLIHEASHAANTLDYFYYYMLPRSSPFAGRPKSGDETKKINKYMESIQTYHHNRKMAAMPLGMDLPEKLNVGRDIDTLTLSKVFSEKLSTDKKIASEIAVNNADSIASYIMGLGTENSKLVLDKINSFLTDKKRKLSFSVNDVAAHIKVE